MAGGIQTTFEKFLVEGEPHMLTSGQLEELAKFDTPTISNAIEFFGVRPRTDGFMNPSIRKVFDNGRRVVGYATTARISAASAPTDGQKRLAKEYYAAVKAAPKPTITVLQDLDPEPKGSFWGEVQVSIHRSLGCLGVITNGGVRDLDEVSALEFEYFAACLLVSHAYVHVEAVSVPVVVGGLTIRPGDLLHADRHGVTLIPQNVAPHLAEACRAAQDAEIPAIMNCRKHFAKGNVDLELLEGWRAEVNARRVKALETFSALVQNR
jgi:4-hydroxy-4-methyl-2-oxoglutarate aldolase